MSDVFECGNAFEWRNKWRNINVEIFLNVEILNVETSKMLWHFYVVTCRCRDEARLGRRYAGDFVCPEPYYYNNYIRGLLTENKLSYFLYFVCFCNLPLNRLIRLICSPAGMLRSVPDLLSPVKKRGIPAWLKPALSIASCGKSVFFTENIVTVSAPRVNPLPPVL